MFLSLKIETEMRDFLFKPIEMNVWVENIIRFVVLFLLQVLLFNNLQFFGLCSPCVFIFFLISLPPTLPRWVELLIGFTAGLLLDIFYNTLGVQTASCTLIAYLRPLLIKRLIQDNDRLIDTPSNINFGRLVYIQLVVVLVVIYHLVMFSLIAFSFNNWWLTLLQTIVSSVFTIAIILGIDLLRKPA